jgi:hypothetical protein
MGTITHLPHAPAALLCFFWFETIDEEKLTLGSAGNEPLFRAIGNQSRSVLLFDYSIGQKHYGGGEG